MPDEKLTFDDALAWVNQTSSSEIARQILGLHLRIDELEVERDAAQTGYQVALDSQEAAMRREEAALLHNSMKALAALAAERDALRTRLAEARGHVGILLEALDNHWVYKDFTGFWRCKKCHGRALLLKVFVHSRACAITHARDWLADNAAPEQDDAAPTYHGGRCTCHVSFTWDEDCPVHGIE